MKILAINGSSKENGNTAIALQTVLTELKHHGIETEMIQLAKHIIRPCQACFSCGGKNNCSYHDDLFHEIFDKVKQADGIILGSPVYSADISSNLKAFIDRAAVVIDMNPHLFQYKIAAAVVVARRAGALNAIDTINHFFLNHEMFIVGSTYWNMVYGQNPGDIKHDTEGLENLHNLGENMAYLLHKLKIAER